MFKVIPGVIFALFLAVISIAVSEINLIKNTLHLNPFLIAIFAGFALANLVKVPVTLKPGITFTLKKLLRLAIILLGFKISLTELSTVGLKGLVVISLSVIFCYLFTVWFGKKTGNSRNISLLLASGTSICGASAIIATGSIIKAEENDSAISVAIISIIGTFFMILYPLFYYAFKMDSLLYSVWAGSSIHEVAQVVAAGFSVNEETGRLSSLIKMSRVTFIVPVTLILLFNEFRQAKTELKGLKLKDLNIPWFVIGFILMIIINSFNYLPEGIENQLVRLDNLLLTAAMLCMGMEITFSKIKKAGIKPIYLCLVSSLVISAVSLISSLVLFG